MAITQRSLLMIFAIPMIMITLSQRAHAQNITVQTKVSSQDVFVGEQIVCQLVIQGAKADSVPTFPVTPNLDIEYVNTSDSSMRMMSSVNGKVTEKTTLKFVYHYKVRVKSTNAKQIPPATLIIQGQSYQAKPVPLKVNIPQETEDFKFRIKSAQKSVYVGEPCRVTIQLYMRKNVQSLEFTRANPQLFDVHSPTLAKLSSRELRERGLLDIEVFGETVHAKTSQGKLEGKEYTIVSFDKIVVAKKPGKVNFGPITIQLEAVVGKRRRSFFDSAFGNNNVTKKFVIPSNKLPFQVKSVPQAPATFTGLIGACDIQTSAPQTRVRVGDPIELTIRVKSQPPLARIKMPELSKQSWAREFKFSKPESSAKVIDGWMTQKWIVRAKSAKTKAIPPVKLTYFNTKSGKFSDAQSQPIAIEVQESRKVTIEETPATAQKQGPEFKVQELTMRSPGILHNYEDSKALTNEAYAKTSDFFTIFNCLLMFGPVLAFVFVVYGQGLLARFGPVQSPQQQALDLALQQLKQAQNSDSGLSATESASQTSQVIRRYLANYGSQDALALSSFDAIEIVGRKAPELAKALKLLLTHCDSARFGDQQIKTEQLSEAPKLLKKIHEVLG